MNRRVFLKALAVASLAPKMPAVAKEAPARSPNDDTAFLQWHVDTGTKIPPGDYTITDTLLVGVVPGSFLWLENSVLRGRGMDGLPFVFTEGNNFYISANRFVLQEVDDER